MLALALIAAAFLTYFELSRGAALKPDDVTPQLCQQVDQWKRDAAVQPTNPQNVADRGLVGLSLFQNLNFAIRWTIRIP
jgi:hypothetical protein